VPWTSSLHEHVCIAAHEAFNFETSQSGQSRNSIHNKFCGTPEFLSDRAKYHVRITKAIWRDSPNVKDMTRPDAMCSGDQVNLAAIEDKREAVYGEKGMNVTYTALSLRRHELKLGGHGDQFECGLMGTSGQSAQRVHSGQSRLNPGLWI